MIYSLKGTISFVNQNKWGGCNYFLFVRFYIIIIIITIIIIIIIIIIRFFFILPWEGVWYTQCDRPQFLGMCIFWHP